METETERTIERHFARRIKMVEASPVREILKVTGQAEVISFAGGLPAPELFPVDELREAYDTVLRLAGHVALQYAHTEGYGPLREWIAERYRAAGCAAHTDNVLITTGSQQAIDLVGRALIDPGDTVLVENPSYLAALQAFKGLEARLKAVDTDEEGMRVEALAEALARERPRLIYVVPNFQNPTGITLAEERRARIAALAAEHNVPILEDDPYGSLRYRGDTVPPLKSFNGGEMVASTGTFSKTLCPGLRVGWVLAPEWLVSSLVVAKQSIDLHTSSVDQRAIYHFLSHNSIDERVRMLCGHYGERCQAMLDSMAEVFPPSIHWTKPEGGMFLWLTLPDVLPVDRLFWEALKEQVAFVPGAPFFVEPPATGFLRLNFSNQTPERIREGIERLGVVIHRLLDH